LRHVRHAALATPETLQALLHGRHLLLLVAAAHGGLRILHVLLHAAHLLHHAGHHALLAQEILDLPDARAAAARHPGHPRGLRHEEPTVRVELLVGHGVADVDHALHLLRAVVVVHAFHHVAEARDHAGHFGERAHFHHVLYLVAEIAHCEDALLNVLHRVFLVQLEGLDVLDQACHVAHAQQSRNERFWLESFEI
ncbi:MAG: hypothetical protein LQ340_007898, partial [Diploschistes diacapsis]